MRLFPRVPLHPSTSMTALPSSPSRRSQWRSRQSPPADAATLHQGVGRSHVLPQTVDVLQLPSCERALFEDASRSIAGMRRCSSLPNPICLGRLRRAHPHSPHALLEQEYSTCADRRPQPGEATPPRRRHCHPAAAARTTGAMLEILQCVTKGNTGLAEGVKKIEGRIRARYERPCRLLLARIKRPSFVRLFQSDRSSGRRGRREDRLPADCSSRRPSRMRRSASSKLYMIVSKVASRKASKATAPTARVEADPSPTSPSFTTL